MIRLRRATRRPIRPGSTMMTRHAVSTLAALVLRTRLGTMFIAHGLLKFFVFTPPGTAQFFELLGLARRARLRDLRGRAGRRGPADRRHLHAHRSHSRSSRSCSARLWVHMATAGFSAPPNGGWEYPAFLGSPRSSSALLGDGAHRSRRLPSARASASAARSRTARRRITSTRRRCS